MATLTEQRRGIALGIAERRAATAAAEREAIGRAIVERRTGISQVDDINSVVRHPAPRRKLQSLAPRGALPAQKGRGDWVEPPGSRSGGIASPLVEQDYSAREYWPEETITSTDGLLSFRVRAIREITQTDANSAEVVQQFAEPVESAP